MKVCTIVSLVPGIVCCLAWIDSSFYPTFLILGILLDLYVKPVLILAK